MTLEYFGCTLLPPTLVKDVTFGNTGCPRMKLQRYTAQQTDSTAASPHCLTNPMATWPLQPGPRHAHDVPGGPAAGGCHEGVTHLSPRAPLPQDQEVEVCGREGGQASVGPPKRGHSFHKVCNSSRAKATPHEAKKISSPSGVRFVSLETSA